MSRHFTACLILFADLCSIISTIQASSTADCVQGAATDQAQPPSQTPPVTVIDGRRHPESVPPELAWEHFFAAMVMVGFDKPEDVEPRAEIVAALSKHNLFIPPAQVRTVLVVSKATLAKVDALRRPFDPEGRGRNQPGLTKAQKESAMKDIAATVLAGRDELVEQLPRKDMVAIDHYLVTTIVPSIKTRVVQK